MRFNLHLSPQRYIDTKLFTEVDFICAKIVKKDPGRANQNSLATAETNFTKPGAHNKVDLRKNIFSVDVT